MCGESRKLNLEIIPSPKRGTVTYKIKFVLFERTLKITP